MIKCNFFVLAIFLISIASLQANLITDSGFETNSPGFNTGTSTTMTFSSLNRWNVDQVIVTTAENGITPYEGSQMGRAHAGGAWADIYYLIDLAPYSAAIANQTLTADVSAMFNTSSGSRGFAVSLRTWNIDPAFTFGSAINPTTSTSLNSDTNLATWEEQSLNNYQISAGAKYIAVGVHAEIAGNGSYIDGVQLTLNDSAAVPEPSTHALMALGLLGLGALKRKRIRS